LNLLVLCLDPGIGWDSKKGASVHLRSMANAFSSLGARRTILTSDGIAADAGTDPVFEPMSDIAAVREYFRAHRSRSGYEMRAVATNPLAMEHVRRLHERRPFDAIYERFSLWSDVGSRLAAELGVPLVLEVNAPLLWEQTTYRKLAFHDLVVAMERDTFQAADRVIIVSKSLSEYVRSRGVSESRILHLANIAERSQFEGPPFQAPAPGAPFVVGFAGSLKPWHGLDPFLDVFARVHRRHPNAVLEILGDGKGRSELESRVSRLGLNDAVRFLGHVPHEAVPARLHRWHLIAAPYPAIPSFYFSPLKIAEALAAGRPIIASDVGEIAEMTGDAAILVEADRSDAWEAALAAPIERPESLAPLARAAEEMTRGWSWRSHATRALEGLSARPGREATVVG